MWIYCTIVTPHGCSFLCPLQKQQGKFSHPTQPASGNSQPEVVLSSLGHQLVSNLAWYSGLHVHCSITAIGFVWQGSCKAGWGLPADPDLEYIAGNKISCAKKPGNKWGKSKQQKCKAISLSEDPEEESVEKKCF